MECDTHQPKKGYKRPPFSKEWRKKMSIAAKNRKHRPLSESTKLKISMAHKGKPRPFQAGPKNGMWIADRSLLKKDREKSYDTKYKYWMRSIKKRDGWKCRIADENCKGQLEAHHILRWKDHPELRYNTNNGITLCQAHHPHKKEEEAKLSPYFQKLVAEID